MPHSSDFDLKLFNDLKTFLNKADNSKHGVPRFRGYNYFNVPAMPKNTFDLVYERIYLGQA